MCDAKEVNQHSCCPVVSVDGGAIRSFDSVWVIMFFRCCSIKGGLSAGGDGSLSSAWVGIALTVDSGSATSGIGGFGSDSTLV